MGFDHSIADHEGYDFAVAGNSFDTSSEPGIVWVMQDENGDGKPNDTWYELAGSETGKSSTVRDYAVTYYRPNGAGMDIIWSDSMGNSGVIKYLPTYHKQDYYYPQWISKDSFEFYGPMLKPNSGVNSSGIYEDRAYEWGYADNLGSDSVGSSTDDNDAVACHLDIANAVTADGLAAELQYVDFVRIQSALNGYDSSMGELSTEVLGVEEI